VKTPGYAWDLAAAAEHLPLKEDNLATRLKTDEQKVYKRVKNANGTEKAYEINFPIRLWNPIAEWWSRLRWSEKYDRAAGRDITKARATVTWLELVVDFELCMGLLCERDQPHRATWRERATLLRHILKLIHQVRTPRGADFDGFFGKNVAIPSLAPLGLRNQDGLLRRPSFLGGMQTVKCIARNAWSAAALDAMGIFDCKHYIITYSGFKVGEFRNNFGLKVLDQICSQNCPVKAEEAASAARAAAVASSILPNFAYQGVMDGECTIFFDRGRGGQKGDTKSSVKSSSASSAAGAAMPAPEDLTSSMDKCPGTRRRIFVKSPPLSLESH
jgi:hypothetical protein